ncbi:hypothetical protein HWV62_42874 [Athelia sp. TMB]|nr:hypothetical protein HWV62_42874 [Athelia sp. TMB]
MPFHALSVELVQKIFVEANLSTPAYLPDPTSIPLVVSAVCPWWRAIAISCPPLWTFYHINQDALLHTGPIFLARAGNALVHMHTVTKLVPPNMKIYEMFTARKAPLSISIGDMWVRCPPNAYIVKLCLENNAASALLHAASSAPASFFAKNASLRHVKELVLMSVYPDVVSRCATWMSNIRRLVVVPDSGFRYLAHEPDTPIALPKLTHLVLSQSLGDHYYGSMIAPRLMSLDIRPGRAPVALWDFVPLLPQLSYLSITGPIHSIHLCHPEFALMRNLQVLRIDVKPFPSRTNDDPRRILLFIESDPHILPLLSQLHTNVPWSRPALDILRQLQCTRPAGLPLMIFHICNSSDEHIQAPEYIQDLIQQQIVFIIRQY